MQEDGQGVNTERAREGSTGMEWLLQQMRVPLLGPSLDRSPPALAREFFSTQVSVANNETEFSVRKTGFYSMTREWRRGAHALKAPSSLMEGSEEILGVRRQTCHQGSRKGVEIFGDSSACTVSRAPLHRVHIVPNRVQIHFGKRC